MPLEKISATASFPTPIFWFRVPDAAALNTDLVKDAQAMRVASEGMKRSNQKGWHSETDLFRRPEASFKCLIRSIGEALHSVTKSVAPKFAMEGRQMATEGWVNISDKGAYNTPHRHPGFTWSGCYYVQVPENPQGRSGLIEFIDPRGGDGRQTLDDCDAFSSKIQQRPQAGMLVIFPSYLVHWVYPNEEAEQRISIAFNARFGAVKKPGVPS
jgi:uncharacterized protein (TIGR02466 family)